MIAFFPRKQGVLRGHPVAMLSMRGEPVDATGEFSMGSGIGRLARVAMREQFAA